jgi:hypothetical protein
MKTMFRAIVALLLVGGWTLAAASLHIVRAPGRVIIVPKDHLSFHEIYIDTQTWTMNDVSTHPIVVKRLMERGKTDALQHVAPDASSEKLAQKLHDAIDNAPPSTQQAALSVRLER